MAARKPGYKSQPHYKKELARQGTKKEMDRRAKRNGARRTLMSQGKVSKGDGKDVHHKTALSKGGSNKPANWQVISASANRKKK
tara:strand:+ start:85 stop:336 length:252 start_codon:yes stop_codon:yes gene_type:complete